MLSLFSLAQASDGLRLMPSVAAQGLIKRLLPIYANQFAFEMIYIPLQHDITVDECEAFHRSNSAQSDWHPTKRETAEEMPFFKSAPMMEKLIPAEPEHQQQRPTMPAS
jgi:hypothetical protein